MTVDHQRLFVRDVEETVTLTLYSPAKADAVQPSDDPQPGRCPSSPEMDGCLLLFTICILQFILCGAANDVRY